MRINYFSIILLLFSLLVSASITRAQTVSSQKGLTTVVFNLPLGKLRVFLPDDIRPGENFSGTVLVEPVGRNTKQIESNRKALLAQTLSFNGNKFNEDIANQQFQISIPAGHQGSNILGISAPNGKRIQSATISPKADGFQNTVGSNCVLPSFALTGSPNSIKGSFDGNLQNTSCNLNGEPITILAESFRQSIVFYPQDAARLQKMTMQESGKTECSGNVSGVTLSVRAGKETLVRGEQTTLEITITGLADLRGLATLRVINLSATTVSLLPSNNIIIPLPADSVSSGNFNRSFVIQSIRSGDFTVSVDLDLPYQTDYPLTQPQPNQPTQPQCPKCNCSCTASIINEGTKDGVITYSVELGGGCSGQWGSPPCQPCTTARTILWQVSFSADKPIEVIGGNGGTTFQFKNPHGGHYTVTVKVTDRCSDGTECTCSASISVGPPTIPEDGEKCPGCLCECGATIRATDTEGEQWEYTVDVTAVCAGVFGPGYMPDCEQCKVADITYEWFLDDDKVVKFVGGRTGRSVTLRTIKPGAFVIRVVVTVTCSDEHSCKCSDSQPGIVPDKGCMLSWQEMNAPAMTGGFAPIKTNPQTIKRDGFISLGATGEDVDMLKLICTKLKECLDEGSTIYEKLAGNVRFEWKIIGPGSFVDIGCLVENKTSTGDQVIFKPPYVALPVAPAMETTVTTEIELSIIDDAVGMRKDATLHRKLTITTKRFLDKGKQDEYEILITETTKPDLDTQPANYDNSIKQCFPTGNWAAGSSLDKPTIILPAPKDSDKLHPGEWMRLEAKEQTDHDVLIYKCFSKTCDPIRPLNAAYQDHLEWTWTASIGSFAGSGKNTDKGRFVIYKAPDNIMTVTKVTITLKVEDGNLQHHDGSESSSIEITIYPGGIKLDYTVKEWVPDPADPAVVESYLVYLKDNKWERGFEHSCRIHFFELMDVSNQPGICLNAPKLNPKLCRDLKLITEPGHETLIGTDTSSRKECAGLGYFMQARTEKPEFSYRLKVHAEDYGAWGFLRSFANISKGGPKPVSGEKPFFKSVPVEKNDYPHPNPGKDLGGRPKKKVYTEDNRINIPLDVDENRIPDNGWIVEKLALPGGGVEITTYPDYLVPITTDRDDEPVGDGFHGDGLSHYEEYRGFMIIKPSLGHIRTSPKKKDLFVKNEDNLPIDAFVSASKISVHEISDDQWHVLDAKTFDKEFSNYVNINQRFINFNFGLGHQTSQKGLSLVDVPIGRADGEIRDVLGITPSEREAVTSPATPAPPNWNVEVRVDRDKINRLFDPNGLTPVISLRKLKQVVAHELAHACNVYHHGETAAGLVSGNRDCIMRYDNFGVRNEVPGTIFCPLQAGALRGRGACEKQFRIPGRIFRSSHGYPTR